MIINKSYKLLVLVIIGAVMFLSCVNNDLEELESNEKKIIQEYLTANNISEDTKTEGGIYYIEHIAGSGLTPVKDNFVYINYVGRYLKDNSIHETSYDSLASEWNVTDLFDNYLFGPVKMVYGYSMPGINEALSLMKEGGKATVIIPSDKANYDYKPLVYEIELLEVIENPAQHEDSIMYIFLQSRAFNDSNKIDTTTWYKVDTSAAPVLKRYHPTDTMYFNFKGWLLDGYGNTIALDRMFDSNENAPPIKRLYGQTNVFAGSMLNKVLPTGLKMALDSLPAPSKATVVLRHERAFTAEGLVHPVYFYTIIPPFQTVVYDIEVIKIESPVED